MQGQYEKAKGLYLRAIAISGAALGPEYRNVAAALKTGGAFVMSTQVRVGVYLREQTSRHAGCAGRDTLRHQVLGRMLSIPCSCGLGQ